MGSHAPAVIGAQIGLDTVHVKTPKGHTPLASGLDGHMHINPAHSIANFCWHIIPQTFARINSQQ